MTVARATRGDRIVDEIRAAIVRGDYLPNERLVEGDLAQAFEASRGAVRAALLELSSEGLVEREANRGARVRALSRDEAVELLEVRMALEGLLAAKAATRASEAGVGELRRLVEAMAAAGAGGDVAGFGELNLALHRCVRELAGHESAARIVERLKNQCTRLQARISLVPGRLAASLAEHQAVVEAIAAGDPEAAEAAMRAHLLAMVSRLSDLDENSLR